MGSNCCKNALDKVRPPAHASSFDPGEPPDPAAPWPGDTFCRAPAAQAPPAFPEGAFDSFPHENQLPNTSVQQADAVAGAVRPSGAGSIGRRISAPAGSGSTAVSLPESQGQQQRTPRIFPSEEPSRRLLGRPGEDTSDGSSYRRGSAGRADSYSFGDFTADGTQRLPARLRQALRASSMRLRSRLRMGRKHDEAGRNKYGKDNGGKALLSTGATAATFPDTGVDDTHFVCYPPASTPSSECLSQGWPAAASPWDDTTCVAAAGDETAAATARETRGKRGGSTYIAGACVVAIPAPSRRTPLPSGVELSANIAGEKGQVRELDEIAKCMNKEPCGGSRGGEEGKRRFAENIVTSPASSRKHHGNTVKDQKGLFKRSRGSSAASSFRAAMEVALPRLKGSRGRGGTKKERRTGRGVVSPPGSSSGGGAEDRKKVKKRKNLIFSGESQRLDFKNSSKKTGTNNFGRTAVRSSHCSSASTAAQEEDDRTTTNVEYWWAANIPSQQTAQEFTPVAHMEPQVTLDFPFPSGQSSTQQPVITGILRQGEQQLAAPDCAVPAIAGPPTVAVHSSHTGPTAIGRPLTAPRETFLEGETHHAEYRTTTSSSLGQPLAGGRNHSFVHEGTASIGEQAEIGRQQLQQSLTTNNRTELIASALAGQEAHGDHREHTSGPASSSSSGHGSSYTARSEDDSSPAAVDATNGDNRRGEQVVMGGGPAWISAQTSGVTYATGAEACENIAQQERAAENRQQEIDDNVDNASSNLNMPAVTVPFPE